MVPAIRNILGGFLFSGDDVYKRAGVLSGGERTRLAVARMLLRPSNTLLLDEPTNHLDLDSKDVLLDALEDYGGTLIFVSHDRYFVERLATKIVEIRGGGAIVYPGTYEEFLWSKEQSARDDGELKNSRIEELKKKAAAGAGPTPDSGRRTDRSGPRTPDSGPRTDREERKRLQAEERRRDRERKARRARIDDLESRIAEREQAIKELEAAMAAPGFYTNRDAAQPVIDRHQALMWEVGSLMEQWESLQELVASEGSPEA
jgi:ATP-binding cassette subfamily F protein 3